MLTRSGEQYASRHAKAIFSYTIIKGTNDANDKCPINFLSEQNCGAQ